MLYKEKYSPEKAEETFSKWEPMLLGRDMIVNDEMVKIDQLKKIELNQQDSK